MLKKNQQRQKKVYVGLVICLIIAGLQNSFAQEVGTVNPTVQTTPMESNMQTPPMTGNATQPTEETSANDEAQTQASIVKGVLYNQNNELGILYAQNALDKASKLIQDNRFDEARKVVEPLQKWLTTSTEIHIDLYQTLKKVTTAKTQAQLEKELALQFAILRDKANYQAGVIGVAQKNYKDAVRYLSDVVKSQPKTDLGLKAYEIMQNIGFTEKVVLEVQ